MIKEKTNVNIIYHIIRDKLIENYKRFLSEDIKHRYTRIVNELCNLSELTNTNTDTISSLYELSSDKATDSELFKLKDVEFSSYQIDKVLKYKKHYTEKDMEILCNKMRLKIEQYLSNSMVLN